MARNDREVGLWRSLAAISLVVAAFLMVLAPVAFAQASEHCPGESAEGAPPLPEGMEIIHEGGESGSFTQDGVTISWEGTTITISGGSVTFCVKAGTSGASGIVTRGPGTYSTADFGLTGPQGQAQGVSHLVVYATSTTTTTTPPPTTTTPPPTTTTPPGGTTTTPPLGGGGTTTSPTVLAGTETNTGSPSPLAFTGRDDVPWLIAAGLVFLLIGTLALRIGSKRATVGPTDWSA